MNRKCLLPLLALCSLPAAAENYFWYSGAANPGFWNDVSNWRTGGDSEGDPETEVPPGVWPDTATFRGGTHVVTAPSGSTVAFGAVNIGERNRNADPPANITWRAPGAVFDGRSGFIVMNDRANFTFAGGELRGELNPSSDRRSFTLDTVGTATFTGSETSLTGWEIVTTQPDAAIVLSGGVAATNILLNLTPYDNGQPGNVVRITGRGTTVEGLTLAGRYYNTTNCVTGGAVVNDLKFEQDNNLAGWNPGVPVTETRFEAVGATIGHLSGGLKGQKTPDLRFGPKTSLVFGEGTLATNNWEYMTFNSPEGLIRVAGTDSVFTNFNFWVSSRDTRVEVADGADVLTRKFILGQHASGCTATLSGPDTLWTVTPRESKVEGFFSVGEGGDGIAASNNWFVIENGARYVYTNSLTQAGGQSFNKTVGLLIGGGLGDYGNGVVVRSGAVVENSGATSIGGGFERVTGGIGNLLRIEGDGTVYRGGVGYADLWDSELLFGGSGSSSNALEVADGAVAEFTGAAWFGGYSDTGLGGARITVDNGALSIATKVECGRESLEYGPHTLEVRGTNGVLRVGAIMQDAKCSSTDWAWRTVFGIPREGRSTDAPMLEVTGVVWDADKDAVVQGNLDPVFDIDRKWAKSGRGNVVTLLAVTGGDQFANDRYRYYENGLNSIAAKADSAQLGACRLSVVVDREDPEDEWSAVQCVRLVLEAGEQEGTILYIR